MRVVFLLIVRGPKHAVGAASANYVVPSDHMVTATL